MSSILDSLRCVLCGAQKTHMLALHIRSHASAEHPSIFFAFAMCDKCDKDQCASLALRSVRGLDDEAHEHLGAATRGES